MAKFTQEQIDLSRVVRQKLGDGTWVIKVYTPNGGFCEFFDKTSAGNASVESMKALAHSYLKTKCEYPEDKVSTNTDVLSEPPVNLKSLI